jgi:predicted flap endonuclease-1-like 5' DNA nuclease
MNAMLSEHKTWFFAGCAVGAWLIGLCFPKGRLARSYAYSASTLLSVLAAISLGAPTNWWGFYVLAVVPAALIGQHALYLGQIKNPFRAEGRKLDKIDRSFLPNNVENGLRQARQTSERDFGWVTLSFRFGVPAVTIALVVGLFAGPLYEKLPGDWVWPEAFVRGARYGGVGAYVYVLIYLSRRNFRHDITSGAAVWSAVDLIAGPLLGGVLGLLWRAQDGNQATTATPSMSQAVIFFAAGLAPRYMASALEEAAKRLLRSPEDKAQLPPPRTTPLTMLRGIGTTTAERLEEEGIEDVHGMSTADPLRLMRNTSFDQRQIVSWIDEAILICALPKNWQELESLGVTGAIDLAWYCDADEQEETQTTSERAGKPHSEPGTFGPPPAELVNLAKAAHVDETILWGVAQRFYWDGQVQLVWVLYQIGTEGVQTMDPREDETTGVESSADRAPASAA